MAIYSLHHSSIGKTTQAKPHTAAAHVRYITRSSATSRIEARRMPDKPHKAAMFMVEAENIDRKNARVSDKLLLALPRELDGEQRAQLVREFAEEITQGRAPWLAAFHDRGKDASNPHVHLVIRDRDPATGKRVAGLSEKGTTGRLRVLWEQYANRALAQAGRQERIDHRTLQAQGIRREPTVHEGPRAQQMDRRGARARSRMRRYRNRPGARRAYREVDYAAIDAGRSRPDYNRQIAQEGEADYWEVVDADARQRELETLRQIHHPPASVEVFLPGNVIKHIAKRVVHQSGRDALFHKAEPFAEPSQTVGDFPEHDAPVARPGIGSQSRVEIREHNNFYHGRTGEGKKAMTGDKIEAELLREIEENEVEKLKYSGEFRTLVSASYADATSAHARMDKHRIDYGNDDLFHTLRTEPFVFGDVPAEPGRGQDAEQHRKNLHVSFSNYLKAMEQSSNLKAALEIHKAQQQGAGSPPGVAADVVPSTKPSVGSQSAAPDKQALKPYERAATAAPGAATQKSPAEIQAFLEAMKAKRALTQAPAKEAAKETKVVTEWDVDDF
jgi:hypothetical protein